MNNYIIIKGAITHCPAMPMTAQTSKNNIRGKSMSPIPIDK
jgi:hypothetical protein